jgi:hypothetical protein
MKRQSDLPPRLESGILLGFKFYVITQMIPYGAFLL